MKEDFWPRCPLFRASECGVAQTWTHRSTAGASEAEGEERTVLAFGRSPGSRTGDYGCRHVWVAWFQPRRFASQTSGMEAQSRFQYAPRRDGCSPKACWPQFFFFQFSASAGRPRVPRDMFPKGKPDQARGEPAVPAQSENQAL